MMPPVFQVCAASSAVTALLGTGPTRLFLFGMAPQGVTLPYAVWQVVGGLPENYLGETPDADSFTIQIDAYAESAADAHAVAEALRDAIEPHAHVAGWRGDWRDPETFRYRTSFDVDWIVER